MNQYIIVALLMSLIITGCVSRVNDNDKQSENSLETLSDYRNRMEFFKLVETIDRKWKTSVQNSKDYPKPGTVITLEVGFSLGRDEQWKNDIKLPSDIKPIWVELAREAVDTTIVKENLSDDLKLDLLKKKVVTLVFCYQ